MSHVAASMSLSSTLLKQPLHVFFGLRFASQSQHIMVPFSDPLA
jgi:hypothetical protein